MGGIRHLGYVSVSGKDQNEVRQLEAMKGLGILNHDIYIDNQSGKDTNRTGYQAMKNSLRKGDILFIEGLDRLGRSVRDIKREWQEITQEIGSHIVILDMPILDTRQYQNGLEELISNIVLELLSYMAEREREKINERQADGIAAALKKGVKFGRPKQEITKEFVAVYDVWKEGEITAVAAMKKLGLKPNTFYRRVSEFENKKGVI